MFKQGPKDTPFSTVVLRKGPAFHQSGRPNICHCGLCLTSGKSFILTGSGPFPQLGLSFRECPLPLVRALGILPGHADFTAPERPLVSLFHPSQLPEAHDRGEEQKELLLRALVWLGAPSLSKILESTRNLPRYITKRGSLRIDGGMMGIRRGFLLLPYSSHFL